MSPEQINEQRYNEKSDIWSLGCIVYEMAALRPPFKAQSHLSLALKIKAGKYDRIPSQYSEDLWQTIQWMLSLSQENRASVEDLIKLPKVQQILPACSKLRSSAESEKLKLLIQKEKSLAEKEQELTKKETALKYFEQELLVNETAQNTKFEEKRAELAERERLLNEILKIYDMPLVNGDL